MIVLDKLTFGYRGQAIVPPLSGHFARGSMTAIIGANGVGKSTLLKTLVALLPPISGRLVYQDDDAPASQLHLADKISYLPQSAEFDKSFPISVFNLVAMGCYPRYHLLHSLSQAKPTILQALQVVGLTSLANSPIAELSGGQLQRALFARLLVQQKPIILLDEPFTGIDQETTQILLNLITQLHQQGKTLIAVLHDINMVKTYFPQVLALSPEQYQWGNVEQVLPIMAPHCVHVA